LTLSVETLAGSKVKVNCQRMERGKKFTVYENIFGTLRGEAKTWSAKNGPEFETVSK